MVRVNAELEVWFSPCIISNASSLSYIDRMDHFAVSGNILAMETRLMSTDVVATQLKSSFMSSDQLVGEDFPAIEQRFQPPPVPTTLQICGYQKTDNCFIYAATEYLLVHPKDYLGALQYCTNPSAELGQGEVMQCISGTFISRKCSCKLRLKPEQFLMMLLMMLCNHFPFEPEQESEAR